MSHDSLHRMPITRWPELQKVLLADWPRSLPGYNVLETQTRWMEGGLDYGFRVYCPFGELQNGFVAINEKESSYDLVIQYPKDDTASLEQALNATKIIDWEISKTIKISFATAQVIECMKRVLEDKPLKLRMNENDYLETFYIQKNAPLFENVELPPDHTFELLTSKHVNVIDSYWPNRYQTSCYYFQLLIDSKCGYGLFKHGELTSWVLIGECGNLTHLYTLENYRRKGYAELLVKLIANATIKDRKRDVFAFCVKTNLGARRLYERIGLKKSNDVFWPDLYKLEKA